MSDEYVPLVVVYAPTKVRNFKQITTHYDTNVHIYKLFMHLQR